MKKVLTLLFLFLSSFCLTSCTDSEDDVLQFGYDFVTLPTEVSEDFLLVSYYRWHICDIDFECVSHNTNIIRIERLPQPIHLPNGGYSYKKAYITRNGHDVDVSIEFFIKSICCTKIRVKTFTITVLGLENDEVDSSSQNIKYNI